MEGEEYPKREDDTACGGEEELLAHVTGTLRMRLLRLLSRALCSRARRLPHSRGEALIFALLRMAAALLFVHGSKKNKTKFKKERKQHHDERNDEKHS